MPLAEKPGAVNDAAHPQHEVTEANCKSQSSKFADALALEISKAPVRHLDFFARQLWAGHANGILTDDQAQDLAEQLADRQRERGRPTPGPKNAPAAGPMARVARCRRVYPRSQDRQASIDRRRQLAASGGLPPHLACRYTVGEQAVLKIIADDVRHRGFCDKTMSEIAGRAGVCVRLAQLAIRRAEGDCLLKVRERRISAFRNKPNVITVLSAEWRLWMEKKGGCKSIQRTQHQARKEKKRGKRSAFGAGFISGRQNARTEAVERPQGANRTREGR